MGPVTPGPRSGHGWRWGLLVVACLASIVVWLNLDRWRNTGFEWRRFAGTFAELDPLWLAGAVALVMVSYFGRAVRWEVMLRPICPQASLWRLFTATAIGFTAVVLFGRAGEMVRPYLIACKEGVSFSSQVAAWFLERLYDLLIVLVIFGFALSQVHDTPAKLSPQLEWVLRVGGTAALVLGVVSLFLLLLFRYFSETMQQRLLDALGFLPERYLGRVQKLVTAFAHGISSTRSHLFLTLLVSYTVIEWLVIIGCYFCIFKAFPATSRFSFGDVAVVVGFVSFGSVIQIPGIGGGMQIVAVIVLTELFGVSLEHASGLAVLMWTATFVVIVPIGLLFAFHEGLSWGKLRHLSAPEDSTPNTRVAP